MTGAKTHSFTLFLRGADILQEEHLNALFENGCDDALFGVRDGAQYGAFDRQADSFSEALASAIADVTTAIDGLYVTRIEPDDFITMAAIATRSGLSREYIRLLSTGKRGPGNFPAPIAQVDEKTRLWHWPDVARWLTEYQKAKITLDVHAAELIAAMNAAFDLREHVGQLHAGPDLALVASALGDGAGSAAWMRSAAASA